MKEPEYICLKCEQYMSVQKAQEQMEYTGLDEPRCCDTPMHLCSIDDLLGLSW